MTKVTEVKLKEYNKRLKSGHSCGVNEVMIFVEPLVQTHFIHIHLSPTLDARSV